jgi:hypothetical protein
MKIMKNMKNMKIMKNMKNIHIKWDNNIVDPIIKRPCKCQCCLGCNKNGNNCNKFGPHYCKECTEYRCTKCYNFIINKCKNCLCERK